MKKQLTLSVFLLCTAGMQAIAQIPFLTRDSVDINNISAAVLVHGDMWWTADGSYSADCSYPKGAPTNVGFASALWLSGYDGSGQLHIAAQTYRQTGNDYWPGRLDGSDTLTYRDSYAWARIWKVYRTDIQAFQSMATHTTSNTPNAILTWPGKGNTYAQGNAGTPLTVTTDMAPFVDVNADGIYEPLLGDYPDVKGDEALWWVFSDNGPAHTETNGKPLDVEVHAMSYAYSRGSQIDNVIYYDYAIINKSANNYSNFRPALRADMDLGYYLDDYIGFDSTHRMGIQYNGTNCDGCAAGSPSGAYGLNPPIVGVSLVSMPGDAGGTYVPAGSFTYYNNDASIIGNPMADTEYNYYMRARLRNGQHITDDYTEPGIPSVGYGTGPACNYVYTGNPVDGTQWSECAAGNPPGDRRFIVSGNDYTLPAGGSAHMVMALVVAGGARGCPYASFMPIQTLADTAWDIYYNPLPPLPAAVASLSADNLLKVYPSPAHDKLYIENTAGNAGEETIIIYNTLGQAINVAASKSGKIIVADISSLPAGLYNVLYRSGAEQASVKFVKE